MCCPDWWDIAGCWGGGSRLAVKEVIKGLDLTCGCDPLSISCLDDDWAWPRRQPQSTSVSPELLTLVVACDSACVVGSVYHFISE